jgi:ATPase subunit of ABC transporter with duplicated ATPase domains
VTGSLTARDLSKHYGAVQVLARISLVVSPGDRIGIVGPNGIGKSTLLRVLAGLDTPDGGEVVRGGAVGYLPQEPAPRAGETVRDYLARRTGVGLAEQEMDELAARLGAEPDLVGAYTEALDQPLPHARR